MDNFKYETHFIKKGYKNIVGIDEAGRGPLAGPVVAVSVNWGDKKLIEGITDSKKISEKKRKIYFSLIKKNAKDIGIGIVHENTIDKINILQATYLAMRISIDNLKIVPDLVLVDGNKADIKKIKQKNIIKGDMYSYSIACASIIAKVTRDRIMQSYAKIFPKYMFEKHKGYGTKKHIESIKMYNSTPIHRKSFRPISDYIPTFKNFKTNSDIYVLGLQLVAVELIKRKFEIIYFNDKYDISYIKEDEINILKVNVVFKGKSINSNITYSNSNLADNLNEYLIKSNIKDICSFRLNECTYDFDIKKSKITIKKGELNDL